MQDSFEPMDMDIEPRYTVGRKIAATVISVLLVVILAVTAALLVKYYVITTYIVDGISMYPTLDGGNGPYHDSDRTNGETLYLNKLAKIGRGDIVVFLPTEWGITDINGKSATLVKRVIAIGGDRLEIKDNVVYLNGEVLDEPYINEPMDTDDLELDIPEGYIFCMGDNRSHSTDCRINGAVPLSTVIGKCFLIKSKDGVYRSC